ncbi:hypothetical protein BXZ70DRAFT_87784 [Cristinia sonorae]|uniref:DUF6533 domain-containing protein n=1 Tax=Cristinia sonorae TaxID=1940300 RepID=A0A8K0XRM3_9AGAR|nr:hypothetical protein BXZ70DRAFT_87784 [Cristinia sonorae]
MSNKLLFSLDHGAPIREAELAVSRASVAALAFSLWDALIYLSAEIEIIWSGKTSLWVRLTYAYMRYVPVLTLAALVSIITSVSSKVKFTPIECQTWQIFQAVVMLSLMWVVDAILIIRLYALYRRSKLILWMGIVVFVLEMSILIYGSTATIMGMIVTPGCLVVWAPPTFWACWISPLSFQTIIIVFMAINFFRTTTRQRRGHVLLRTVFRDGSWAYVLIFFITISSSFFYSGAGGRVAGTPYAWAMALYSFAGCHLQMNLHKNGGKNDPEDNEVVYPPLTSLIEMSVLEEQPPSRSQEAVASMLYGLP